MTIPIARPFFDSAEEEAAVAAIRSGWVSHGPKTVDFEKAMAAYVGVAHARAVNSGLSAIHLALLALGVRAGDEVVVPAFTCVATLFPVMHVGAVPVPVDIALDDFAIDPACIERAITPKTRAIVVAHLFGIPAKMDEIMAIAKARGLLVLEDNALGLGGTIDGRQLGSFGDAAAMSFHPRKLLCTGEGGMVVSRAAGVATAVAELRAYGASVSSWERHIAAASHELPTIRMPGFNLKMTDIQAGIGLQQLAKIGSIIDRRRRIAAEYDMAFRSLHWLRIPTPPRAVEQSHQSYVIQINAGSNTDSDRYSIRERLIRHLAERGVASVQAAQDMTTLDFFKQRFDWSAVSCPMAREAEQGALALPIFPSMSEADISQVIAAVLSFQNY